MHFFGPFNQHQRLVRLIFWIGTLILLVITLLAVNAAHIGQSKLNHPLLAGLVLWLIFWTLFFYRVQK